MKRTISLIVAAWLVCAVSVGAEGHAFGRAQVCDGEHMAMVNGVYTTCATLQQGTLYENMDAWSPDSTLQQTMDVTSNSHWDATVTETDSSNPRVVTYPDSESRFTHWDGTCNFQPDWSTLNHLSSTFAISGSGAKGDWDESYDLFFNSTAACGGSFHEVMVYTKWHGNVFAPTPNANFTTADGTNYDVYWSSDFRYIQVRQTTPTASGTVHLLQVLGHLNTLGVLGGHDHLDFVQYGVEVVSGLNTAADCPCTFHLTDFSLTAN